MANIVMRVCLQLLEETGIKLVALSGGVFQNRRMLSQVFGLIKKNGLTPLIHTHSPCHDGGISLGQAAIANFIKVEN
jgi:hydrogenase maturation protein HypF